MKSLIVAVGLAVASPALAELPTISKSMNNDLSKSCYRAVATAKPPVLRFNLSNNAPRTTLKQATNNVRSDSNFESKFQYYDAKPVKLEIDGLSATIVIRTEYRWRTTDNGGWGQSENKTTYSYHECAFEGLKPTGDVKHPVIITSYHTKGSTGAIFYLATKGYVEDYHWISQRHLQGQYSGNGPYYSEMSFRFGKEYEPQIAKSYWNYGDEHEAGAITGWKE